MATLVTDAIVLHAFDYLETSRIMRLMTREAGIQSVLARGARRSAKRFGGAIDLFAQGMAEIHMRPNRDLQTLASLDVTKARPQFALDVGRLTAGSMIAELVLRTSSDEPAPGVFDAVAQALDGVASASPDDSVAAGLAGAWHIIATLGFTPALDVCASCHAVLPDDVPATFSLAAGGALCGRCALLTTGSRVLPSEARAALRAWVVGESGPSLTPPEERAHQRLLREFVHEHLGLDRELRAFRAWERGEWTAA